MEKKMLSLEDIESQTVLELPARELLAQQCNALVTVCVNVDVGNVDVDILNNAHVCAAVGVITAGPVTAPC